MNAQTDSKNPAGPRGAGRVMAAPVYGAAILTVGFICVPGFVDVSYEHGELLLLLNSLLVTGVSAWVAALAFRGYLASGLAEMRYAGCGLVAMGSSFLLAGLIIASAEGLNRAVTVHNLGVLCGSFFHLAAAWRIGQPGAPQPNPSAAKTVLAYVGVLALVGGVWAAAAYNLTPAFYLPDKGTTPVRQLVLLTALALLTAAAAELIRNAGRRPFPSIRYYGLGLMLISLGLADVFIAVPGSVLSWTGRLSQYGGHLYILAAFLTAIRAAHTKGMDVQETAAEYYFESEDHYRALVNALRAAVISIDPGERVVLWNPKAEAVFGYTHAEATGKPVAELLAAAGDDREAFRSALKSRPEKYLDMKLCRKGGEVFSADVMVFAAGGGWKQWTNLIIRDTTARKQAEEALRESEERLRLAHAAAALGMWMHEVATGAVYLDGRAQDHYGAGPVMPLAEIVARVHPDDRPSLDAKIREALDPAATEDRVAAEYRVVGASGAVRWLSIAGRVVFDGKGASRRAVRVYGVSQDVTERRTAEQALRRSEETLRQTNERLEEIVRQRTAQLEDTVAALKNEVVVRRKIQAQLHQLSSVFMDAADPIIIEDLAGTIIEVNREAELVYGWSRAELIGQPIVSLFLPERCHLAEQLRERCRRGEEIRGWEGMRKARSGRVIPSLLTAFPLMDESGKIAFVATISKDISGRKEMEVRLRDSQRHLQDLSRKSLEALEADRRMVSRELHDSIGGSLAAIKFGLEDAAEQASQDPGCRVTSLPTIISQLADTIKETKRISANLRPLTLDDLGLLATIDSYSRQFNQRYGNIRLVREIRVTEAEIPDEFKIVVYRVMQEAFTNAAKHSRADTLHIRLRREAAHVLFEVEDNGCGFDVQEVFSRNDGMSGFGLKSMQERTEICEGVFKIQSEPGAGTCIRVTLPIGESATVFAQSSP